MTDVFLGLLPFQLEVLVQQALLEQLETLV